VYARVEIGRPKGVFLCCVVATAGGIGGDIILSKKPPLILKRQQALPALTTHDTPGFTAER
jgi:uncharacterized membrane protein YeiH